MPKISILIRCKNEAKHLPEVFAALRKQTLKPHEVIIVDSGSTDNSLEIAQNFGAKIISIPSDRFTYGYALNIGFSEAEGNYVAILSADATPTTSNWLEHLLSGFIDPRISAVYGRQIPYPNALPFLRRDYAKSFPDFRKIQATELFFSNANAMVQLDAWKQTPYDEKLSGAEDWDFVRRQFALGNLVIYEPNASVYHPPSETIADWYRRARRETQALKCVAPHQPFVANTYRMVLKKWLKTVFADFIYFRQQPFSLSGHLISPWYRLAWVIGEFRGSHR